MKLNPALKKFWIEKKQIKILYGGRISSKTEEVAGALTYLAHKYKLKIACIRQFQNKIDDSVYSTLKRKIEDDEIFSQHYQILKTKITSKVGSELIFKGIRRNLTEIKGLDSIDITWIEEAETLTKEQWDIISPTILRKDNSFIIITFNPSFETDFIYKRFVQQQYENVLVRKINYYENPFISKSALALIEAEKQIDYEDYEHYYLGIPKQDSEDSIIKRSWVEACIDAHKKLNIEITGIDRMGFDVADAGKDTCCVVASKGCLVHKIVEWKAKEDELFKSSKKAYAIAKELNAITFYDSIGVGAGLGSHYIEFNKETSNDLVYLPFNAGEGVHNPNNEYKAKIKNSDYFLNLKAQTWWEVADRMKETYNAIVNNEPYDAERIISISSEVANLDKLKEQLCIPRKVLSKSFKNMVEGKKELIIRGVDSPNVADAFVMNFTLKRSAVFGGRNINL